MISGNGLKIALIVLFLAVFSLVLILAGCLANRNESKSQTTYNTFKNPCQERDTVCNTYFNIWLSLHKKTNNLSQEFISEHIRPIKAEVASWEQGRNFQITYDFVDEWASVRLNEVMPVFVDSSFSNYLDATKYNEYLGEQDIWYIMENNAGRVSSLKTINPNGKLLYNSLDNALSKLKQETHLDESKFFSYSMDKNGNILLHAINENKQKNECVDLYLNLYSGDLKKTVYDCVPTHR